MIGNHKVDRSSTTGKGRPRVAPWYSVESRGQPPRGEDVAWIPFLRFNGSRHSLDESRTSLGASAELVHVTDRSLNTGCLFNTNWCYEH